MERVVFDATDPISRLETDSFDELIAAHLVPIHARRDELKTAIQTTSDKIVAEEQIRERKPQLQKRRSEIEAQTTYGWSGLAR